MRAFCDRLASSRRRIGGLIGACFSRIGRSHVSSKTWRGSMPSSGVGGTDILKVRRPRGGLYIGERKGGGERVLTIILKVKTLRSPRDRCHENSNSAENMSSSPSPNAETSTQQRLFDILRNLEGSVSSAESLMLMGAFISIVSCSGSMNSTRQIHDDSMLTDATQIFNACIAHQRRVMITRSRVETWSAGPLNDRAELWLVKLSLHGLKLSWQKLETSFLICARDWIRDRCALDLWGSASTLTGSIGLNEGLTVRPGAYLLSRTRFQRSVIGYERTWEEIEQVSGPLGGAFQSL